MDLFLLIYSFFFTAILGVSAFFTARTQTDYYTALLFVPLALYFGNRLVKHIVSRTSLFRLARAHQQLRKSSSELAEYSESSDSSEPALEGELVNGGRPVRDLDRRLFLKLIASSGISLFIFAVLGKKSAQAAFFGSVPGPGTVAVKDSTGTVIDPAEKQSTDGYEIAQIDDNSSTDYAWYGFVNKDGAWYIMQEDLAGANAGQYLYSKGDGVLTNFSTNWALRNGGLSYGTFDSTF